MSGIIGFLNDLYIRFMVWLGAEPPPGYEYLTGAEVGPREYTLQQGDTLFSVARKFKIHNERLAQANGIEQPGALQPGQTLIIPPANWDPASGPLARLQPASEATAPALEVVEPESPPAPAEAPARLETRPTPLPPAPPVSPEVISTVPVLPPAAPAPPVSPVADTRPTPVVTPAPEEFPVPERIEGVALAQEPEVEERPAVEMPPVEDVAPSVTPVVEPQPAVPEQELVFRYEVQQGDTLSSIARRYDVSVDQLIEVNSLTDERLFAGQKLVIPGYSPARPQPAPVAEPQPLPLVVPPSDQYFVYTITRGDTLHGLANRYGVTVEQIIEANQIEHPDMIRVGQQLIIPRVAAPAPSGVEAPVKPSFAPPTFAVVDPTFPPYGLADAVRALYVSYFAVGHPEARQRVFQLLESTELNAVVIDVKTDEGLMSYPTQVSLANEIGAARPLAQDFDLLLDQFKAQKVYTIARIVTFKDSLLAKNYPEYAVKLSNTAEVLPDQEYLSWNDPFLQPVWDYNIQIAVEAAQLGFDEILFSRVRFPSQIGALQFSQEATREARVTAITGFLSSARGQLRPYGVKVAADTLGYTCWRKDDYLIGQDIERMGQYLDTLCPMLYPSTFGSGISGYKMAVAYPYEVVYESARRAVSRVAPFGCGVRPWIQDFPDDRFDKRVYGKEEIQAQIKGCFDAGSTGFMVWNNRVRYMDGAYAPVRITA